MQRRSLLLGALVPAALAPLAPAQAARGMPAARRLMLRHATTGARFAGTYHDGRTIDPSAMADISAVLADSRSGTIHAFDPAVLDFLWETGQRAGLRGEFLVVSGFRTPATNAAVCGAGNSQHLRAGAIDVCVAQAQLTGFSGAAVGLRRGGVGLYAGQGFVHLDSGPVRQWGLGGPAAASPPVVDQAADRLNRLAEAWAATRPR